MHKSLNNLPNCLLKAKNKADNTQRQAINNMAEAAFKVFKIKIMPMAPKAEPIRLML